ncbi:MAG: response regulator [Desulfobacter sp.]|nr:MAG: response regulator [Desulfobacter sp.]
MLNLLLFTNDPGLQDEARKAITGKTYALVTAPNYQEAVGILGHVFISMVVVDFNLSRIKCTALLEHVQEHYPDIPVIALSSTPLDQEDLPRNISASYMGSPFVSKDLQQIIEAEIRNLISGGTISNVSPPSLAQLLEMEGKSCILRIFEKKAKAGGLLVFRAGKLIDSRFGGFKPIEAACRILAWDEADIYIQNKEYPVEDRINLDLKSIIVRSVHMKDEGQTAVAQQPPPAARQPKSQPKEAFPKNLGSFLDKHLDNRSGIVKVGYDAHAEELLRDVRDLGPLFELGRLRLICADDGAENGLFVDGPVPTTVTLSAQSPLEKITLLITRFLDII